MKRILLAFLIASTPIMAEEPGGLGLCGQFASFAKRFQEANQKGASMTEIMSKVKNMDIEPPYKKMLVSILRDAFRAPSYSIEKNQQREIVKFENFIYTACLDGFGLED